jgi:hypothetical protein
MGIFRFLPSLNSRFTDDVGEIGDEFDSLKEKEFSIFY